MKAIKFELYGKSAMFKKPDVNSYAYFTYNNIHKVALLGILGAVIGLGGYNRQSGKLREEMKEGKKPDGKNLPGNEFPEFYERLKDLKVSIVPDRKEKGYFTKKIQVFNNSVGYASKEEGGNLIVREQWLENPRWTVYLLEDGGIEKVLFEKLREYLVQRKCEYMPYLGKNDHMANISGYGEVDLEKGGDDHLDSLFFADSVELDKEVDTYDDKLPFIFKEVAPIGLNREYNFYEFKEFMMTNRFLTGLECLEHVYSTEDRTLQFF